MKRRYNYAGFTLIELLMTLAVVGVFLVLLAQCIAIETKLTEASQARLCIEDEERYLSEFLFECLYSVEVIEIHGDKDRHPISDFDFTYIHNYCPILGSRGDNSIRFVQDGRQMQIWDLVKGNPQIRKALANHVTDATCELIENNDLRSKPLLHVTLEFEAGHTQKSYDLFFAMRNLS